METLKKILGFLNPGANSSATDKAGTATTIAVVLVTILSILCKFGVVGSCVAPIAQ